MDIYITESDQILLCQKQTMATMMIVKSTGDFDRGATLILLFRNELFIISHMTNTLV